MFGPFNEDGKLSGGIKGKRIQGSIIMLEAVRCALPVGSRCVSAVELKCMIDEEEKTDILDVYVVSAPLPTTASRGLVT